MFVIYKKIYNNINVFKVFKNYLNIYIVMNIVYKYMNLLRILKFIRNVFLIFFEVLLVFCWYCFLLLVGVYFWCRGIFVFYCWCFCWCC